MVEPKHIISVLKDCDEAITMTRLVSQVRQVESQGSVPQAEVRAAVLPLIASDRVELTPDRKLRLRSK